MKVAIQPFTDKRLQILINDGNILKQELLLKNGEEKVVEIKDGETITLNEVK
jgi:hypothetical protein